MPNKTRLFAIGDINAFFGLMLDNVIMATIVLMDVFKIAVSFCGPPLRRLIPRAALLGSIAIAALLLIARWSGGEADNHN